MNTSFHDHTAVQFATAEAQAGQVAGGVSTPSSNSRSPMSLSRWISTAPTFFVVEIKSPTYLPSTIRSRPNTEVVRSQCYRETTPLATHMKEPAVPSNLSPLADSTSFVVDTAPIGGRNTHIMQEKARVRARFLAAVEEIRQIVRDLWYGSMYPNLQPSPCLIPEAL